MKMEMAFMFYMLFISLGFNAYCTVRLEKDINELIKALTQDSAEEEIDPWEEDEVF